MTLSVRTSEPASDEFSEAVRWYEARRSGLGGEFFNAVAATLSLVEANPEVGMMISGDGLTRRALVGCFVCFAGLLRASSCRRAFVVTAAKSACADRRGTRKKGGSLSTVALFGFQISDFRFQTGRFYSPRSPVRGPSASSGSTKYSMSRSSSSSSSLGCGSAGGGGGSSAGIRTCR